MKMFVHIPRTGGTSLLSVFKKWYGRNLLTVYSRDKEYRINEYAIACGHFYIEDMDEYLLFLREPYLQQVSYYNYTVKYQKMPSIDDFFINEESSMVRFLPPMDRVGFVGIYERYEEDVIRLADRLGMKHVTPTVTNTASYNHYPSKLAKETFIKNNEYIYELYNSYL